MLLLTKKQKENINKKYPLYSQDGKGMNAICVAKFFVGNWTWYVTEGSYEDGDFLMFGIVINGWGDEYGYTSYNELQKLKVEVKTPFGVLPISVERDKYFEPKPLCKIDEPGLKNFLSRLYGNEKKAAAV